MTSSSKGRRRLTPLPPPPTTRAQRVRFVMHIYVRWRVGFRFLVEHIRVLPQRVEIDTVLYFKVGHGTKANTRQL